MSKKIIALAFAVFALAGCGEFVTGGDTICGKMKRTLYAGDVFGTGPYIEYQDEFTKTTGCQQLMGCNKSMTIEEDVCLEDIEVK